MKISWGHGILIALGAFMIFILGMIFYFTQTMQNSELITEDYYQEELLYQQVIDAKKRADALAEKPEVFLDSEGILIIFPQQERDLQDLKLILFRTDDKNLDIKTDFSLNDKNQYLIPKKVLAKGSYTLKLMWKKNKESYQMDYDILWK